MLIIRYNKSARVVSYRVYRRFLSMYHLGTIRVHVHVLVIISNDIVIGTVEYK